MVTGTGGGAPRAFMSHSSQDKARFVVPFAEKLRAAGVDVWLDYWEMRAGDSLVTRIFEDGIGEAAACIIVLSKASLASPWVAEELDAAAVRRIEGRAKLIPVVIEDVEVPVVLKATLHVRVPDLDDVDGAVEEVARAIFGITRAPPLGRQPSYASETPVGGLCNADSTVLRVLCELVIERRVRTMRSDPIVERCEPLGLSRDAVVESLAGLEASGHVEDLRRAMGGHVVTVRVAWYGLQEHLQSAVHDLAAIQQAALAYVLNAPTSIVDCQDVADALKVDALVVETVLRAFEPHGLQIRGYLGGKVTFRVASPALRRQLK